MIVNGGRNSKLSLDRTEILNLTDNKWLSNVPLMNEKRDEHACMVMDYTLYSIGGYGLDTIEMLDVFSLDDVVNKQWMVMNGTLTPEAIWGHYQHRAVKWYNDIVIFGGSSIREINAIDTISRTVRYTGDLYRGVSFTAGVVLDAYIYAFGGLYAGSSFKTYQYWKLRVYIECVVNYK